MKLSAKKAAHIIGAEIIGNAEKSITGVSSFSDAGPDEITFADDPKFLTRLTETGAQVIIVPDSGTVVDSEDKTLLAVSHPRIEFFKLVELFHPPKTLRSSVHPGSTIGKSVSIGKNPVIEPNVYIGDNVVLGNNVRLMPGTYIGDDVTIGDSTVIKPNVTIMERSRIGSNVIIHSGTVIGSDGFGFAQADDRHQKLVHTGFVSIGDDVEIGACNTIDRGTLGMTRIGNGVKTDNQVHIAHNVKIGDNSLLVAQVGIAGSTTLGQNVIIAGKSAVTGHIHIGDNTIVGPYSGVYTDVPESQIVSGVPHMPHKTWLKMSRILPRLPEMRKTVSALRKRIKELENKHKGTDPE